MRLSFFIMATAAGTTFAQTCQSKSLLSCLAAPVSTLCSAGGTDYRCVCSQLSAQSGCYPSYCPTSTFGSIVQSQFDKLCNGGGSPATTTEATLPGTTTGPAANSATTTGATPTKSSGAAHNLGIPAVAGVLAAFVCGGVIAL